MPNLFLHIVSGLLIAYLFRVDRKSILLLGSILPDIKIFAYLVIIPLLGLSEATAFIIPIHSPFGSLLLAVFLASLFPRKEFLGVFTLLAVGVSAHFMLDMCMFPVNGIEHYLLFYPFTWEITGINTGSLTGDLTVLAFAAVLLRGCMLRGKFFRF